MKKNLILLVIVIIVLFSSCFSTSLANRSGYIGMGENVGDGMIYYTEDIYRGLKFYHHDSLWGSISDYAFYIGENEDGMYPRIKVKYSGSEWLFFDRVIFMNDQGEKLDISGINSWDKETDVKSSSYIHVEEKYDKYLDPELFQNFKKVMGGSNVRFALYNDSADSSVYWLSEEEIRATNILIDFFESN